MYHLKHDDKCYLSLGYVVSLDYQNPYISPYQELQRFKLHPRMKGYFENGKRVGYGARALNEGGTQVVLLRNPEFKIELVFMIIEFVNFFLVHSEVNFPRWLFNRL